MDTLLISDERKRETGWLCQLLALNIASIESIVIYKYEIVLRREKKKEKYAW